MKRSIQEVIDEKKEITNKIETEKNEQEKHEETTNQEQENSEDDEEVADDGNDDDNDDGNEKDTANNQTSNNNEITEDSNKKQKVTDLTTGTSKWTRDEDLELMNIVHAHGPKNWKNIAKMMGGVRSDVQCLHRYNKVLRPGLQKGSWTEYEDAVVRHEVMMYGNGKIKWALIADKLPGRLGKQCRERWFNHLDPNISRSEWTNSENRILFECQNMLGNKWCEFMKVLPGRTENSIKNRWHGGPMKRWFLESGEKPNPHSTAEHIIMDTLIPKVKLFRDTLKKYDIEVPIKSIFSLFGVEADRVKKCYYFEGRLIEFDMSEFGEFDEINVPVSNSRFDHLSKHPFPYNTNYSEYTAGAYPAYNRKAGSIFPPNNFNNGTSPGIIMEIPIRQTSPYEPSGLDSLMSYRHHIPLYMMEREYTLRQGNDSRHSPRSSDEIIGNNQQQSSTNGNMNINRNNNGNNNGNHIGSHQLTDIDNNKAYHMKDLYSGPPGPLSTFNDSDPRLKKNFNEPSGYNPNHQGGPPGYHSNHQGGPSFPSQYAFNGNTSNGQNNGQRLYPPNTGRYLPQIPMSYNNPHGSSIPLYRPVGNAYNSESMYTPYAHHATTTTTTTTTGNNNRPPNPEPPRYSINGHSAMYFESQSKFANHTNGGTNVGNNNNDSGAAAVFNQAIDSQQRSSSAAVDATNNRDGHDDTKSEGSRSKFNRIDAEQGLSLLSSMLPPHLRPAVINTNSGSLATLASLSENLAPVTHSSATTALSQRMSPINTSSNKYPATSSNNYIVPAGNDASAKRLINMLHNLKSNASSREPSSPSTNTDASKSARKSLLSNSSNHNPNSNPKIPPLVGDTILPSQLLPFPQPVSSADGTKPGSKLPRNRTTKSKKSNLITEETTLLYESATNFSTASSSSALFNKIVKCSSTDRKVFNPGKSNDGDVASVSSSHTNQSKATKSSGLSLSVQLANSSQTNVHISKELFNNQVPVGSTQTSSQINSDINIAVPIEILKSSMTKLSETLGFQLPVISDTIPDSATDSSELTPLTLFPHFKFLHTSAQKSLLTQLLCRLISKVNSSKKISKTTKISNKTQSNSMSTAASTEVIETAVKLVTQVATGVVTIDAFLANIQ